MTFTWSKIKTGRFFAVAVALIVSLIYSQKIFLPTADLGRHLKNGQVIWQEGLRSAVMNTNYYSYTNPQFVFVNHHWLYGVIIWPIFQTLGFTGLSLFNFLLFMASLALSLIQTGKQLKRIWFIALFFSLPLIIGRSEVRPEIFSLLSCVLIGMLYYNLKLGKLKGWQFLISIFLLEAIWVNLHLFFPLGLLLVGYYLFDSLIKYHQTEQKKTQEKIVFYLGISLALSFLGSLINPHGINGILTGLRIFNQYQYPVAENQSTMFFLYFFKEKTLYWYYLVFCAISLLNFSLSLKHKKGLSKILDGAWLFIWLLMGIMMIRLYPFVALILLPFNIRWLAENYQTWGKRLKHLAQNQVFLSLASPLALALLLASLASGVFTPNLNNLGFGVNQNTLKAQAFLQKLPATARVFNNYDAGGYLIFSRLAQKVFVDNRPEFYPAEFMEKTYIAAQQNEAVWQKVEQEYNLDIIFFYRHDATDWGQPFLIRRIQDADWLPVYVDDYFLCLAKNTLNNQALIEKYKISKEIFQVTNL